MGAYAFSDLERDHHRGNGTNGGILGMQRAAIDASIQQRYLPLKYRRSNLLDGQSERR